MKVVIRSQTFNNDIRVFNERRKRGKEKKKIS